MTKLTDLTVEEFIQKTSSDAPAPGGGSIAALSAATGAALVEMVCNLTIGNERYAENEEIVKEVKEKAVALKEDLIELIEEDANSFNTVIEGFRMPKDTEEEKEKRREFIQNGYKHASNVPFTVGEKAFEIFDLAEQVVKYGNPNAVTDGAVAALNAATAVKGAFYNVKINIGSIKDQDFVTDLENKMKDIEDKVDTRKEEILSQVDL